MAASNSERVGNALDILKDGLVPFVERQLKTILGEAWQDTVRQGLRNEKDWQVKRGKVGWDAHLLLSVMWNHWNDVFRSVLGHAERSLVSELREVRNKWAHQKPFTTDDAYRALDSMHRLLTAVSAEEAQALEGMKQELLRIRFDEQARRRTKKITAAPTEGQPAAGLKPWRSIVTPHPDVASGEYHRAEFAADLAQVHRGEGVAEYREPVEFFQRTFLTEGLKQLLRGALLRISGNGGDPIIQLQTNFGGGKTHSMLALYHLFSGTAAGELAGVEEILNDAEVAKIPVANTAVFVGTAVSPANSHKKPDGTAVNTLWGDLAWQLGKKKGYAMVKEADEKGVNPGSGVLAELFQEFGPALILIDEWIAFVRQLYHVEGLPAGSFDANFTFAQALTEAAKQTQNTFLVVTIPASDIEIGGEGGQEGVERLRNIIGRTDSPWRPASAEEGFEIVRRRLFQPLTEKNQFADRDTVIKAFSKLYQSQSQEFPPGVGEGAYEKRMAASYPIHPDFFDRLYEDWASLDTFQRTRGVLRLMAAVIHELWERNDGSLLILPAAIPIDAQPVQSELMRYLDEPWMSVIEKDVDGPNSLPLALDRANPNLGRYSACRRVARTIYMGSAPTGGTSHPGIDERQVKLGCVQPGESVATFGDGLRRLTDQSTHLYVDGARYWYATQPSVTRLAQDRAAQQDVHDVWEELKRRLRADRTRGGFAAVHAAPEKSADVPDEMSARLVILGPEYPHHRKEESTAALEWAEEILNQRGTSPRKYRNTLVFLGADRQRLADLESALRQYLAWNSIVKNQESLNLDAFQSNQATTKKKAADEAVAAQILEAYSLALVPHQKNPQDEVTWDTVRLQGSEGLTLRVGKKLESDENLIAEYSATRLLMDLNKYLWKSTNHVNLRTLWEYYATYLYLPRLRDNGVLLRAVKDGLGKLQWEEYFAYAAAWDEKEQKYLDLTAGRFVQPEMDGVSVLVKPDAAKPYLGEPKPDAPGTPDVPPTGKPEPPGEPEPDKKSPRRFYGAVELDVLRMGRDASQIAEEVVQHLASLPGASVKASLEIQATMPDGAGEKIVRTVTENCRTLKFKNSDFEVE